MDIAIGAYKLKEEFNTQQKVEQYFATKEDNEDNRNIKQGLYDLISNVILFEVAVQTGNNFISGSQLKTLLLFATWIGIRNNN